ncbi:MAG: tetratricopeptide repeat protein [Verrucomicrobiota bacterium]
MPFIKSQSAQLKRFLICCLIAGFFSGCASREEQIGDALKKSDGLILANKTDEAIAILSKSLAKFPDSAPLYESLGLAQLTKGEELPAIQSFRQTISLDIERSHLWKRIADLEAKLGQDERAIQSYNSYLAANPNDFLGWKNLSELHEGRGEYSQAIKMTMEWNNLKPSSRPAYQLGRLYYLSNNLAVADLWYTEAAREQAEPTAKDALAALVELKAITQEYIQSEQLLSEFEKRYGRATSDSRIQSARTRITQWRKAQAEIAEAARQLEEERKELERQKLEAEKRETEARNRRENLASIQDEQLQDQPNSPTDGLAAIEDNGANAPELFPDDPADPIDNGIEARIQTPNTVSQPRPQSDQILIDAQKAFDEGDYDGAINLYMSALGDNTLNANVWHQLALAYSQKRAWPDAEAYINEARRHGPQSAAIAGTYLRIISNTQGLSRLSSDANSIRASFPNDSQVALAIAQSYLNANAAPQTVARAYRDFLQLADAATPGYQEAQRYLGL